VNEREFVDAVIAAVPEAFDDVSDYLAEPLPYVALGDARMWLEEHALQIGVLPRRARVRPELEEAFRRFWAFVEEQARDADDDMKTMLQIECFEGVGWVEDVIEYVGPATRQLLADAQVWLARYNRSVGRWNEVSP
jgi:hypothetical protein